MNHVYSLESLIEYKRTWDRSVRYATLRSALALAFAEQEEVVGLLHDALVLAYVENEAKDLAELLARHVNDCTCVWQVMSVRTARTSEVKMPRTADGHVWSDQCPRATHPVCDWAYRPSRSYYQEADELIQSCVVVAKHVL